MNFISFPLQSMNGGKPWLNDAISEGDPLYIINPDLCTECIGFYDDPQCVAVCPTDACVPDPNHQETKEQLMEKKKKIHGE